MAPSRVRIPPSPLAQRPPRFCAHPRRGGRAVECGGLENRYPSLGGSRVQIPPPPPSSQIPQRCGRLAHRVARLPVSAHNACPPHVRRLRPGKGERILKRLALLVALAMVGAVATTGSKAAVGAPQVA